MDSSSDLYLKEKSSVGLLGEEEDFAEDDSVCCTSESSSDLSMEEGEGEEVTSSSSSSSTSTNGPLQDMSSLLQQLPFKRGLSKHYQGKSQSFTSLNNVLCLEDLVKPENPYKKKLKCCRSYACGLSEQSHSRRLSPPSSFSRMISKKASRGSCFTQMSSKRSSDFRPPMPPHRSTSTATLSNHTALFA